jgi:geranylgeranyl diphosphate synthase type II
MLMACNLYSDRVDEAVMPALGMELFHNFTLLHDDLMDGANMRRCSPTVHVKWNPNTAILSGDALLILAYKLVGMTAQPFLAETLALFTQTALEICEGQQYDMDFEARDDVSEDNYIHMIRLKTAVLPACCLKSGARIGGASMADADILYRFGTNIGLAFQLQDDLLDVYGDPETFGKNIGGDILADKKTLLLILALQLASDKQKEVIRRFRNKPNDSFQPEEKLGAVINIYNSLKIRHLVEEKVQYFYKLAMQDLEQVSVPSEKLEILRMTTQLLMNRKS